MVAEAMSILESVETAIQTRTTIRIEYAVDGIARTDVVEPYTLGEDDNNRLVLAGFYWASDPPPAYCTGRRSYLVGGITSIEVLEHKFGPPHDESAAKDWSQFQRILCSVLFPAGRA